MSVRYGVAEDGMLVAKPTSAVTPFAFEIVDFQAEENEKRIWYSSQGRLYVPRGTFHIHINHHCIQLKWDGYRLTNMISGEVIHDVTAGMPPKSMLH